MINDDLHLGSDFNRRHPATEESIRIVEEALGTKLPDGYREFLKVSDGGEGFIGKNGYLILWGTEDLVSMNNAYEVAQNALGFLLIGSDGGGEAYGFDMREPIWTVVQLPFVGMSWKLSRTVAPAFDRFLECMQRSE